jgi:hypothetical protein
LTGSTGALSLHPHGWLLLSLCDDLGNAYRSPGDRLVERWPRLGVLMLLRNGGLVEGTVTELQWLGTASTV